MDVGRGEKLALFLHQSNTHTGNQSGKPSSQHLTSSKSLSVVRLWGFKAEGGFISQTGEVSGEVPITERGVRRSEKALQGAKWH